MDEEEVPAVVSVEWLKEQLDCGKENLLVLDVTWYSSKDGRQQYIEKHIVNAVYFDPFHCSHHTELYPRNLPEEGAFEVYVQSVGVDADTHVVVYDQEGQNGFFVGSRAWWTLRIYGLKKVSVLNGGLQMWEAKGYPVTKALPAQKKGSFKVQFNGGFRLAFVEALSALGSSQFVDSRSKEKYKTGHIQGAINIPFTELFNDGLLKTPESLRKVFEESGVDLSQPIVTNCNSGMSSTSLALAAHIAGAKQVKVYNGGMTEWKVKAPKHLVEYS